MTDGVANARQQSALEALRQLRERGGRSYPADAETVAMVMGLAPGRRCGNGAVKGSWSGRMPPGFHLASTLRALERRGYVRRVPTRRYGRLVYTYRLVGPDAPA